MYLSISGSPGCGKTTLFTAMSAVRPSTGGKSAGVAVIDVPDERIDRLTAIFRPRKTVYGRIEICDTESIREGVMKTDAVAAKQLQEMRLSDAFLVVLKHFDGGSAEASAAAFQALSGEFMIADMIQIETRLERIRKQSGKKEGTAMEQEKAALEECLAHLEQGAPLSTLASLREDGKSLRGFQFLSLKPIMAVVNCGEETIADADAIAQAVASRIGPEVPVVATCARLEAELVLMDPSERPLFMEEYGLTESLRGRLIRLAYRTLGLISFLTVGEDECRAWPIRQGMSAQEAAGVIHTDLSDRFIRAETVGYEDFMRHGDFPACKKAGVWRLEGKQYIVRDGDIISVRAGN
jgi:GTP-binding protein YchF